MESSFETAVMGEVGMLYRVARRLVLNNAEAEDLVSQTLCSAARAWSSFDGRHTRGWLVTILKNEHLKSIRRAASRPRTVSIESLSEPGSEEFSAEADNNMFAERILVELDALAEDFRLAVALCDLEQMSYQEAATVLGVPIGTVRSRLFRGRRALRERLKDWVAGDLPGESSPEGITV